VINDDEGVQINVVALACCAREMEWIEFLCTFLFIIIR